MRQIIITLIANLYAPLYSPLYAPLYCPADFIRKLLIGKFFIVMIFDYLCQSSVETKFRIFILNKIHYSHL